MEQFIGCDAHKKFSVFVAVNEKGQAGEALRVAHDRQPPSRSGAGCTRCIAESGWTVRSLMGEAASSNRKSGSPRWVRTGVNAVYAARADDEMKRTRSK